MNIHFFLCVSQLSILLSYNYDKGEEESSKLRAHKDHCQSVMRISLVHLAWVLLLEQNKSYRKVEHIHSNVFCRCLVADSAQVLRPSPHFFHSFSPQVL